jgi:gliding motility-associated-like protein
MISRFTFLLSISMIMFISILGGAWKTLNVADPLSPADFTIVNTSCKPTGSITLNTANTAGYLFSWQDASGIPLGSTSEIKLLTVGDYKLTYTLNGSDPYTLNFRVIQAFPTATIQNSLVIPCDRTAMRVHAFGSSNATISTYRWEDAAGTPIGDKEFMDLSAGQYYLTITDINGCSSNRASINVTAASTRPTIDQSREVVTPSGCASDGSITGLTVSSPEIGPFTYIWKNSAGDEVGDEADLIGVPAGQYRLTVRLTAGQCETVSPEIEVKQINSIVTLTNSVDTKPANCEQPNGAITGVKTNATSYRWIDVSGNTVVTTLDMVNVKEGYYRLILSNDFGCLDTIGPFHIQAGNAPIVMQTKPVIRNDSCNLAMGSILGARAAASGIRYSWTDASGKEISTDPDLRDVRAGDYLLTVRNPSCSQSFPYTVQNIELPLPAPIIEDKFVCSATDILINFTETAPLYRIYDQNGKLLQESKGRSFMLHVEDNMTYYGALSKGTCESARTPFKVAVGEAALKIPSSFSPNNDGTNDTWVLKGIEVYNTADVKIFNRYGLIVYHSTNPANVFDGKKDGYDLPSGVYYYIVKLTIECKPFTGSVTVLR